MITVMKRATKIMIVALVMVKLKSAAIVALIGIVAAIVIVLITLSDNNNKNINHRMFAPLAPPVAARLARV